MKFQKKLVLLFSFLFLSTIVFSVGGINMNEKIFIIKSGDDYITHTVTSGDTVYSISQKYTIPVNDLYAMNPGIEKGIRVGQKIKIPATQGKGTKQDEDLSHTILPKQTIYGVALSYGVTVDDLTSANPGLNENNFKAGKTIAIPKKSTSDETNKSSSKNLTLIKHTVVSKETLYSISKKYDVSTDDIFEANPILLNSNLKVGMKIDIPSSTGSQKQESFLTHQVEKGEAIYGIAQKYGLTVDQLITLNPELKDSTLKSGMKIRVENTNIATNTITGNQKIEAYRPSDGVIRIGILLPFSENQGSVGQDRWVDYYQGFLLSLKELKEKGYSTDLVTFDIGEEKDTKKLKSLLETVEMNQLDLIIGGVHENQIKLLTDFSLQSGIKYVVPVGSKISTKDGNNAIFQATTPHSSLESQIFTAFRERFNNDNIIFISRAAGSKSKGTHIESFKKNLKSNNIAFSSISLGQDIQQVLEGVMNLGKKNIIIPESDDLGSLKEITNTLATFEGYTVSLFGYPEWQTYDGVTAQLHKYDTYIYSSFFLDESNWKTKTIMNDYKQWYGRGMVASYPRYAFLGYDIAQYFVTALNRFGKNFQNDINNLSAPTLQSSLQFRADEINGGYINKGVYFVHYKPDMVVDKIEIKK